MFIPLEWDWEDKSYLSHDKVISINFVYKFGFDCQANNLE